MVNLKTIDYSTYLIDENKDIIDIDDKFTMITGYTKLDIKNNKINQFDLIFDEEKEEYKKLVDQLLGCNDEAYIEHRIKRKDGSEIYVFCLGCYDRLVSGDLVFKVRIIDVTESLVFSVNKKEIEKKYSNKLRKVVEETTVDALTGLLRREIYEYKVTNCINNRIKLAFMMIDIDNFKGINDNYGHMVGDRILKEVAAIIKEEICDDGFVCRLGGDEFSVLYLNQESKDELIDVIKNIQEKIKGITIRENKDHRITLSFGITYAKEINSKITFDKLYKKADDLLYDSKRKGKNTFSIKKI